MNADDSLHHIWLKLAEYATEQDGRRWYRKSQ